MTLGGADAATGQPGVSALAVAFAVVIAGSGLAIVFQILRIVSSRICDIYTWLVPARKAVAPRPAKARSDPYSTPQRRPAPSPPATTPGTGLKSLMKQAAHAKRATGSDFTPASDLHLTSLRSTTGSVTGLAWAQDASALAAATDGGSLHMWTLPAGRDVGLSQGKPLPHASHELRHGVSDVAFGSSAHSVVVQTRGEGGAPALTLLTLPTGHGREAEPAWTRSRVHAATHDGRCLEASGSSKMGQPIILSSSNKTDMRVFSGAGDDLGSIDTGGFENYAAAVSLDGRWVAAATFTNDVKIYEVCFDRLGTFTGLHKAMALKGHSARVLALAFSPDLGRAATASADGSLKLWNIGVRYALNEDPKLLASVPLPLTLDPKQRVRLAWGAGGVLALSNGTGLAFFDEATGSVLDTVPAAHAGAVAALAWSPGKLTALDRASWVLATGGGDGRVRLWRAPPRSSGAVR